MLSPVEPEVHADQYARRPNLYMTYATHCHKTPKVHSTYRILEIRIEICRIETLISAVERYVYF